MTIEEKIAMYRGKKAFIDSLNRAFETHPSDSTIESVEYEVYEKEFNGNTCFHEFLVVTFNGGAISVRNVSGNGNMANFVELAKLINNGYYDEVAYYNNLASNGFERVVI